MFVELVAGVQFVLQFLNLPYSGGPAELLGLLLKVLDGILDVLFGVEVGNDAIDLAVLVNLIEVLLVDVFGLNVMSEVVVMLSKDRGGEAIRLLQILSFTLVKEMTEV